MRLLTRLLPAICCVAALHAPVPAFAQVNVNLPWVRATTRTSAAVFMRLEAHAGGGIALVGASSPLAKSVKIIAPRASHLPSRAATALTLAAGSSLVLKPGAAHLLLTGLRAPLIRGGHVPLSLRFEAPGKDPLTVDIDAEIVGPHDKTAIDHEKEHQHTH